MREIGLDLRIPPLDFLLYYAGGLLFLIAVLFWRRPKKGMRLRLTGGIRSSLGAEDPKLAGKTPPVRPSSHSEPPSGERIINVVFNYNGHSWDAYEVLGLPAGSGLPVVEAAFKESMDRVDASSKPFMQAAFEAIRSSHAGRRASG